MGLKIFEHSSEVRQNIYRCHTNHAYALSVEKVFPSQVILNLSHISVQRPINLDSHSEFCTIEVEHESSLRTLPSKFQTMKPSTAKMLPENSLRVSLFSAEQPTDSNHVL